MPLFVTVTPGTTITPTTTLSASTLNLLGTPSVDVTGSVDGGTLSVADGSLSLSKFAPITGNRLIGNGSSVSAYPAELSSTDLTFTSTTVNVATSAITESKLAARAATFAKIQAIGTGKLLGRTTASSGDIEELTVGSGLTLSGGTLTNGILRYTTTAKDIPAIGAASQAVQWLTSATELPAVTGSVVPQIIRVVLRCKTNDGPFVVGNELDIRSVINEQVWNSGNLTSEYPITISAGMEGASTTNLFLNVWFSKARPGNRVSAGDADSQIVYLDSTGTRTVLTRANWQVKAYLMYASTWA